MTIENDKQVLSDLVLPECFHVVIGFCDSVAVYLIYNCFFLRKCLAQTLLALFVLLDNVHISTGTGTNRNTHKQMHI